MLIFGLWVGGSPAMSAAGKRFSGFRMKWVFLRVPRFLGAAKPAVD
jgi:hypothetical protein